MAAVCNFSKDLSNLLNCSYFLRVKITQKDDSLTHNTLMSSRTAYLITF